MEILVSVVIVCATATVVTSLLFKCGMVWRDVSQYRVAVHELSAQLEELTLMEADSVAERIELLKPSAICCLLYTSPSPRDKRQSRMPSSA